MRQINYLCLKEKKKFVNKNLRIDNNKENCVKAGIIINYVICDLWILYIITFIVTMKYILSR